MSYPLRHISQSASVFMTIAITFERYCAVHHPINYNQVGVKVLFEPLELQKDLITLNIVDTKQSLYFHSR